MAQGFSELAGRYLTAQLAGDRDAALRVLDDGLAAGLAVTDLGVDVIGAAQREIGRLWQDNTISIADEHTATAISQFALAHLYRHLARAPRNGRRVHVACVEGEQHEMGPRIASDLLDAAGYTVRFLGANVPTDSLITTLRRDRPDALALSATLVFHFRALRRAVERVRAEVDPALPLFVGGHSFAAPAALDAAGVHRVQGTAHDLVAAVSRVLGVAR